MQFIFVFAQNYKSTCASLLSVLCFFFNDTATTEIYTLSLHDALPIFADGYPGDAHAAVDSTVKALIGVYGVYDPAAMWEAYRVASPLDNNIENFLGATLPEDRQLYFDASPISYATYANNKTAVLL